MYLFPNVIAKVNLQSDGLSGLVGTYITTISHKVDLMNLRSSAETFLGVAFSVAIRLEIDSNKVIGERVWSFDEQDAGLRNDLLHGVKQELKEDPLFCNAVYNQC